MSIHWPLLVAEQLDERQVISELRPRAGAVADLGDELVRRAPKRWATRWTPAHAVCWLIGETPR